MRLLRYLTPRFTLRAMLVVTTLLCVWCAYSINWIKQRRAAIASGYVTIFDPQVGEAVPLAPGLLWMFGERGYAGISVRAAPYDERGTVLSLFPEAAVAADLAE